MEDTKERERKREGRKREREKRKKGKRSATWVRKLRHSNRECGNFRECYEQDSEENYSFAESHAKAEFRNNRTNNLSNYVRNFHQTKLVTHLLPILLMEIIQIILRESDELVENYPHMKNKKFDRKIQIKCWNFRTKFVQHVRRPGALWKDFTFEIQKKYLDEWRKGIGVSDYQALKDLLIS